MFDDFSRHNEAGLTGLIGRRRFLQAGMAAMGLGIVPQFVKAAVRSDFPYARILWLRSAGTGEAVRVPFTVDGVHLYLDGYFQICRIMRDFHVPSLQGDVEIDVRLVEGLYEIQRVLALNGIEEPITVHSGYRTPHTNREVGGVLHSYHMQAKAVDFHVEGVPLRYLADVCSSRPIIGGLGYYPDDGHIHIDCGPHRYWTG